MLLTLLKLYLFLARVTSGMEIGHFYAQGKDRLMEPQFIIGKGGLNSFQGPLASPFTLPASLNFMPVVSYLNPHITDEDYTDLAGKSNILTKFASSLKNWPKGHKNIVFTKPVDPQSSNIVLAKPVDSQPSKPEKQWFFRIKVPDLLSHFHNKSAAFTGKGNATTQCKNLEGKFVLGSCFRFFKGPSTFANARAECQKKGGDLWTPDLRNPFLLHFIALAMPEFATAPGEVVWLGAMRTSTQIITIDGQTITDAILVLPNEGDLAPSGDCSVLLFKYGQIYYHSEDCTKTFSYVCEYPTPIQESNLSSIKKFLKG